MPSAVPFRARTSDMIRAAGVPMPKRTIDVNVLPAYQATAGATWLRKVALAALAIGDPKGSAGASIVVADDPTLHDLNHRFRGLDEPTDVLAFGRTGEGQEEPGFDFPETPEEESLGEVVISHQRAAAQAAERGVAINRELALLVVHGVLHLLGHDHAEPEETVAMQGLENEALAQIFAMGSPS